jgi:hypothetical protein
MVEASIGSPTLGVFYDKGIALLTQFGTENLQ